MSENRVHRVYVCGPMAGYPGLNQDAFEKARHLIEAAGYRALIPHAISPYEHPGQCFPLYPKGATAQPGHNGGCHLRGDIAAMVMADSVYRLPGWERSRGACLETAVAVLLGIPITDADPDTLASVGAGVGQETP